MRYSSPLLIATVMATLALAPAHAESPPVIPPPPPPAPETPAGKLEVGSPAPAFKPERWIQGEPVTAFEKDKVYLIECWATWCGPCIRVIPHVNALQNKFKDRGLVVIGANVWDGGPAEKIADFVKARGDRMTYRVVFDGKAGDIAERWLKAAGVNGIPHAFVVRENKVLWHGHPGELTEETMGEMIAGKYAPAKPAPAANPLGETIAKNRDLKRAFKAALTAKQFAEAEAVLKQRVDLIRAESPGAAESALQEGTLDILLEKGEKAEAMKRIRALVDAPAADSGRYWLLAVRLTSDKRLAGARDHALALRCLDKLIAAESDAGQAIGVRHLRARLLQATGKTPEALAILEEIKGEPGVGEVVEALKAGRDWPAGKFNPDAAAAQPVPAAAPVR